jgi:hypothetical protein
MKQVIKRIEKAFSVLAKLGYVDKYRIVEKGGEYFLKYKFNIEKDNECHISSYLDKKKIKSENSIEWEKEEKKPRVREKKKIEEAIIVDSDENSELSIEKSIAKAKKNIYVSKNWNKRVDNKIKRVVDEFGESFAIDLLNRIYKRLNTEIKTTLVQYMNGIIKNMKTEKKAEKKDNLQLFKQVIPQKSKAKSAPGEVLKKKYNLKQVEKKYAELDEIKKIEIEQKALEICEKKEGVSVSFLLQLKKKSETIYMGTILRFIAEVMDEM